MGSGGCVEFFKPLSNLTRKTAILVALASLLWVSELASIELASIELASIELASVNFHNSAVSFSLLRPRNSQRSGTLQTFTIPEFSDSTRCPVGALRAYGERTATLRKESNVSFFIGLLPPYSDVGGNTLSRWIKEILKSSGVDTKVFSAHSTRGAAASSAAAKGVPLNNILKASNWARESTFNKFYNKYIGPSVATEMLGFHNA